MTVESTALSAVVFLPLVGVALLAVLPRHAEDAAKQIALLVSLATFVLSLGVLALYDWSERGLQFVARADWIPVAGVEYHLAVDGISLPLLVLSALLTFLATIYSFHHIESPGRPKAFLALVLLLQVGMAGTFVAFDLVLFFVFFELVLVPMYFLIGIWGGENRRYAAIKLFLYTLAGSVFMLVGFIALSFGAPERTFDITALQAFGAEGAFSAGFQNLVFIAVFLGFAIKVPMWPFHTWLPDAHTEAPTVGSVLLAGILLKMGTYGFVRIALPVLPDASVTFAPVVGVLAVIAIIYGALACLAQRDLKRLIAYSSIGHMGFVMLGIATLTPAGINAALFGMIAHGVITGMLFFLSGSIKHRFGTREIAELGGGMLESVPRMGWVLGFVAVASLGLPGLAGFWGEFLALVAAFNPAEPIVEAGWLTLFRVLVVFGAIGTVLTAGYFLWMMQRVLMGRAPERWREQPPEDIHPIEFGAWSPLLVLTLALGPLPFLLTGITDADATAVMAVFGG